MSILSKIEDQPKIKIGCIGGGMMAQIGHIPFYESDPRVELVAVSEERPSLQNALSEKLGSNRVVPHYQDILTRQDINAVVISAPRPATGPITRDALNSGKHVLAEKPMAHTFKQAEQLVQAAKAKQKYYAVGYMKLFDPGVQTAKKCFDELVQSERLGTLISARFYDYSKTYTVPPPEHTRPQESRQIRYKTWLTYPDWLSEHYRETYAWFMNAASHDINLLTYFLGAPEVMSAICPNSNAITAIMQVEDIPVTLEIAKTEAGRWLEGAEFLFEKGRLSVNIPSPMATDKVSTVIINDRDRGQEAEHIKTDTGWCFAEQAKSFIDLLSGEKETLPTLGERALLDMQLIETLWQHIERQ